MKAVLENPTNNDDDTFASGSTSPVSAEKSKKDSDDKNENKNNKSMSLWDTRMAQVTYLAS